ncbi:helix-turn-helix domain-containing protein [Streptomyces sp. 549]|uniref:TetR/AcrR family transcriptional regulator n=1 Tax=Streptomyces sp. 549 TaxID=3049076 RepID=UPI0024C45993|nr:helix-turn-helix domain-containing protein [Streptomyces sp. 549]MDK1474849.1 helix-turn-helix domain-containing protein [Streptomyces sp. 549]
MAAEKVEGKRAAKARQTRERMLEAARELFVEQGYGVTTLQDIANRAGVAVQTIYFTFTNKRSLLKELVDITVAGDHEPVATMDRPWFREALATPSAEEHLRAHVHGTRLILARVAPLTSMVHAAMTTDPAVASMWPHEDPRHVVQTAAARSLLSKPGARPDVPEGHAADVLYGILSTDLYLLFVRRRGWSPEQWEQWAFDTLRPQLCAATTDDPSAPQPPASTA